MSARDLMAVALAYSGIETLMRLPVSSIWFATESPAPNFRFISVLAFASLLAIGLALVAGRLRVANWLFGSEVPSSTQQPEAQELAAALFAAAGLWLAVSALLNALNIGSSELLKSWYSDAYASPEPWEYWPPRISLAAQLCAGVSLVVGSKQLAAWWHRIRTAGHSRA